MNSSEIIKIIKKYGMKPAIKREVSLFSMSVINIAYGRFLGKEVGFSYKAIISIDDGTIIQVLMNEEYIAGKTEELLKKGFGVISKILVRAKSIFDKFLKELDNAEKISDEQPEKSLKIIADHYTECLISLGIYNCFWRYASVRESDVKLSPVFVERIAKDRDCNAYAYHRVEKLISKCEKPVGEKYGFDASVLKYMTLNEFKSFLSKKSIPHSKLKELLQRKKGYLHLSVKGKECVITDKTTISKIKSIYEMKNLDSDIIKGKSAYPGIVKGYVFNLICKEKYEPRKDYVLVTYMTKPDNLALVSKCSALVTDEGGLLCHAAITARELKKPCVISTKIATRVLKDGDFVEVDANKGVVRKLR